MNSEVRPEPMAVSIAEAARMVGMSRTQFYRLFIAADRVTPIPLGRRRTIDVEELRAAYKRYKAEARGDDDDDE